MAEQFIGEIRVAAFDFAPNGWALCQGQLLPIQQNQALFSLLGTFYGGNGVTTFQLPDLRGRVPVAFGPGQSGLPSQDIGTPQGQESVTLTANHLPPHTHPVTASVAAATVPSPAGGTWALPVDDEGNAYVPYIPQADVRTPVAMAAGALSPSGQGQPLSLLQPSSVVNYIIALTGIFPSRQ